MNLVGPYLEEKEDVCLGVGADFLALISDGVSRAIRGKKIYRSSTTSKGANDNEINRSRNTWAFKAAAGNVRGTNVDFRRSTKGKNISV